MLGAVLLQVILIGLNAVFASAEIAVISIHENRLKQMAKEGNTRAVKLEKLTRQPARFLATIQVAITLAGLMGSAFAAENFASPLVAGLIAVGVTIPEEILKNAAVIVITMVLAYFSLVFGELVPKRIAMKKSETLALGMSGLLYFVSKLFAPLVFLLTVSTNFILRCLGMNPEEEEEQVSEEEIKMLLNMGSEQGVIKTEEKELIQNVFEFDDISIGQICTHRMDAICLDLKDGIEEWENIIFESRHSHYPICGESQDDIIGILDTKDFFRRKERDKYQILEYDADKPYFVPETMKADILLKNMKQQRNYFAVLLDEYGGFAGIITLHDLMEELVGEMDEEEEEVVIEIEQIGERKWKMAGSVSLEKAAAVLKLELPVKEYETYGGYLCSVIGRVPNDGEQFTCDIDGAKVQVHTVKNHRITDTTIELLQESEKAVDHIPVLSE